MKKIALILILLFFCVGCDQGSKYTAGYFLKGQAVHSFWGDVLRLGYVENRGGFLSLGAGMPDHMRFVLFVVLVSVFLAALLIWTVLNDDLHWSRAAASTLIISGGLGNLIDRIVNHGAVIDFMNVGIGSIRTGIFNMADIAIAAGLLMLAVSLSRKPRNRTHSGR
jgi:signal peptidase II